MFYFSEVIEKVSNDHELVHGAIRTKVSPSKQKWEITKITNRHNTKKKVLPSKDILKSVIAIGLRRGQLIVGDRAPGDGVCLQSQGQLLFEVS